jgi:hypothetical protein
LPSSSSQTQRRRWWQLGVIAFSVAKHAKKQKEGRELTFKLAFCPLTFGSQFCLPFRVLALGCHFCPLASAS